MSVFTENEVIAVIEKALEMKVGALTKYTRAEEVDIWDSVGQLSLLVALDKLFEGKIANISEMAEADSMPKVLAILKQHLLLSD